MTARLMPIYVQASAEPMSERSLGSEAGSNVIVAQSDASRVLLLELQRYCREQTQGRSFLIAGHRGAGKTTAVADVLLRVIKECANTTDKLLRPMPVFLHGPSLFTPLPSERSAASAKASAGAAVPAEGAKLPSVAADIENQTEIALKQVVLGLHRATVREFVRAYRSHLEAIPVKPGEGDGDVAERRELAAQFEIEILEDPPASRLREFWDHANALASGVLGPSNRGGGAQELVALNGICNAHQRLSGELSGKHSQAEGAGLDKQSGSGFDFKAADALKPVASLLSGAAVAGGAAAATHSLWKGALIGAIVSLISSFSMKHMTTSTSKRERTLDTVFIPDLSVRTLDRILPTLLERLRAAGLAPVFVIDELDKIRCLPDRIVAMVHDLKKLFAETVFTCFLTDRSYLEHLRLHSRNSAYSVAYSYFSHPLLIAYEPADLHAYLSLLLTAPTNEIAAQLDLEVLKWVLRHRSQMHALDLARELMSVRSVDGKITLAEGRVRTQMLYRIDATFQVAIEFILTDPQVVGWKAQRLTMRQTMLDALYYVSRVWLRGDTFIDLGPAGLPTFDQYLRDRMNLIEVTQGAVKASQRKKKSNAAVPNALPDALTEDDLTLLRGVTRDLARFLCDTPNGAAVAAAWSTLQATNLEGIAAPKPEQSVLDNLLASHESVLYREPNDPELRYRFRYYASGTRVAVAGLPSRSPVVIHQEAHPIIAELRSLEKSLASVMDRARGPYTRSGAAFRWLQEEARVLPTTPAWSQVSKSIQSLEGARHGVGNTGELDDDLLALRQFREMLASHWPALDAIFATGAFLGGIRGDSNFGDAVRFGVLLLSAALDFAANRIESIVSRIAEVQTGLQELSNDPPLPGAPPAAFVPLNADAQSVIQASFKKGIVFGINCDWKTIENDAWNSLERRLAEQNASNGQVDVSELLCAAAGREPGASLPLNLRPSMLRDFTRLLTGGIGTVKPRAAVVPMPASVVGLALQRLGVDSLGRGAFDQLAASVASARGESLTDVDALHRLPQTISLPAVTEAPQIAVVIPLSMESAAMKWSTTPTRGFVLVLAEGLLHPDLTSLLGLFAWWPGRVWLVRESPLYGKEAHQQRNEGGKVASNVRMLTVVPEGKTDAKSELALVASQDGADRLLEGLARHEKETNIR